MTFLDILTIPSLQHPRGISQNVSGLYYVQRGVGYKIHMYAKLYCLGRASVFSSVATDFGPSTYTIDSSQDRLLGQDLKENYLMFNNNQSCWL